MEIAVLDDRIEGVSIGLRATVDREVFRCRNGLEIMGVVSLQPSHECHAHPSGKVGIFTIGLHAAAPPRVAEYVDVGRPEGESLVNPPSPLTHRLVVFGSRFVGNYLSHLQHEIGVPGRRQSDCLRKHGRPTGPRDTVQCFIPPVIGWDLKPIDRGSVIEHLPYLLLQGHSAEKISNPILERKVRVQVVGVNSHRRSSVVLGMCDGIHHREKYGDGKGPQSRCPAFPAQEQSHGSLLQRLE